MSRLIKKITAILISASMVLSAGFSLDDGFMKVPEITPVPADEATEIQSYQKGIELLKSSYYNDISKSSYEEDIVKMSSLDILSKISGENFSPSTSVTGFNALEYLVNLSGNGDAVRNQALNASRGMDAQGVKRAFNQAYQTAALAGGIITNADLSDFNKPVKKQTFALWLSRATGVNTTSGTLSNVNQFKDFGDISPDLRPVVESLVENNIMSAGNDGYFNPKGELSRGQAASILNKASEYMKDGLNITSNYGIITNIAKNSKKTGISTTTTRDITVKNVDGTSSVIKTSYVDTTRQKSDFVVNGNGVITDSSYLKVGNQIEYVMKDGVVRFVSLKENENFYSQITEGITSQTGLTQYFGTIGAMTKEEKWVGTRYNKVDRIKIKNFDGKVIDLIVTTDNETGVKNDANVIKNGKYGGISLLSEGDQIEYYIKDQNKLVFMNVKKLESTSIPATVRNVFKDPDTGEVTLTLFDYSDRIIEYPVAKNILVMINENYGDIMDLQYSQEVTVTVLNGKVTKVVGETFIENPGYIPKFGKVRFGTVAYLYPDSFTMELSTGETMSISVDKDIPIVKSGETVSFRSLRQGDKVKVYFDDISSIKASALELEKAERLVKQIYKGEVSDINSFSKKITITNLEYLKNKDWARDSMHIKEFKLSDDAEIYLKGKKINLADFTKLYKNSTVYAVVEDSYGKDLIVKMNIQEGGERFYYDKVQDIDKAIGELELRDKTNFRFDEGTIVLKDSRVINGNYLQKLTDVFVVSGFNTYYDNYANVVKVQSKGDSVFNNIYIGAVEQVHGSYFNMANYATVKDNIWETVKTTNSPNFYFNNTSLIYDQTKDKNLKYYEFFNGKYSRAENLITTSTPGLKFKRYYGVVVTDDRGQVIGVNIRHKGLLKGQNFDDSLSKEELVPKEIQKVIDTTILTRGIVDEVQSDWNRIKLTDSHDWIQARGMWVANPVDKYVEYDQAIIIKDDKVIESDELEPSDYLYIVRTKEKGLVIVVE